MPTRESFEDEAAALVAELSGSPCQVLGTGELIVDVSDYAEAIAGLPDRTGWLDEPWVWVGSTELLAAAREATLVGEAEHEAWIVFTDADGQPRGRGARARSARLASRGSVT